MLVHDQRAWIGKLEDGFPAVQLGRILPGIAGQKDQPVDQARDRAVDRPSTATAGTAGLSSSQVNTSPQVMVWESARAGIASAPAVCGRAGFCSVSMSRTAKAFADPAGTLGGPWFFRG